MSVSTTGRITRQPPARSPATPQSDRPFNRNSFLRAAAPRHACSPASRSTSTVTLSASSGSVPSTTAAASPTRTRKPLPALATVAGNAVKLAAAALRHQQQRTVLDDRDQNLGRLADMIVNDLFSLGFDLHALSSAVTQADEGTPMAS